MYILPFLVSTLWLSSPPVVLLAVLSSCSSRCPLTILVQQTNLVTLTNDDIFS